MIPGIITDHVIIQPLMLLAFYAAILARGGLSTTDMYGNTSFISHKRGRLVVTYRYFFDRLLHLLAIMKWESL